MYSALVVEEDIEKIKYISDFIETNTNSICVTGNAMSGREAIDKIKELNPEILIIAIKINGINGLEVIKKIRGFNDSIHIIIVSEYDYYEFLREAIRYKVDEYILKPFVKREFKMALEKIVSKINIEQKIKSEIINNSQLLDETMEYMENNLVYSVLFSQMTVRKIKRLKEILKLNDYAYVFNIELGENLYKSDLEVENSMSVIYDYIKNRAGINCRCVVGMGITKGIIVFVSVKELGRELAERELREIKEFALDICKRVREEMECRVRIGIGEKAKVEVLYNSYEEALKGLKYEEKGDVVYIGDLSKRQHVKTKKYSDLEKKLLDDISYGKEDVLDTFILLLDKIDRINIEEKRNKMIELFVLCYHGVSNYSKGEISPINYKDKLYEILSLDEKELREWAYKRFQNVLRIIKTRRDGQISKTIENSIVYIKERYNEELSLEEVAGNAGVTPQYFSKLFKEEIGVNFIEYISKLRIDKAKELMHEDTMSIKEIGYMVGYNDPNYFSRIFKKLEGVSPTQYVKQLKNI